MQPKKNVKFAKGRNLVQQKKEFVEPEPEPEPEPEVESESEPNEDSNSSAEDDDLSDSEPRDTSVNSVGGESEQDDDDVESGDDEDEADDQDDDEGDDADDQDNSKESKMTSEEKKQARKEQREKRKFDFERNERTIFVGNLPSSMDHRDVAKLFKQCGPVESARIRSIVPEKEKLSPKVAIITQRMHPKVDSVNAYVVFAKTDNDDCIKKALAMNGKVIKDHHIRVDRAQHPNSKRLTLTSRKKSIFVGNLRFDLRDDDLIGHFQKAGEVDYVRIVRDRATGLGKGFGFVKFMERAAVKEALKMNDSNFKGRLLRVKKVDDKMKMDDNDKGSKQQKGGKNELDHANNQQGQKRKFDGKGPGGPQKKPFNNNKKQHAPHQRNFDKPVNQRKFERAQQHGKKQNRRVQFDLNNNKSSKNPQQQEQPRKGAEEPSGDPAQKFQKVMMTKKTIKKKKTILKKKMNKNRQIKG